MHGLSKNNHSLVSVTQTPARSIRFWHHNFITNRKRRVSHSSTIKDQPDFRLVDAVQLHIQKKWPQTVLASWNKHHLDQMNLRYYQYSPSPPGYKASAEVCFPHSSLVGNNASKAAMTASW